MDHGLVYTEVLVIIGSQDDIMHLAAALAYFRRRKGFTQLGVAKRMGVPHTTVRDLEARGPHSLDMLMRYADALDVELEINLTGKVRLGQGL